MLRQSVFGRLAGYEDVNDAERLRHDPAMRWIVGGKAASGCAASSSQMGRFETRWLTSEKNISALAKLSGQWIDEVHARRPPRGVVLDMDSSVSPTHGEQENSVWSRERTTFPQDLVELCRLNPEMARRVDASEALHRHLCAGRVLG
jgi:hypothetical protein